MKLLFGLLFIGLIGFNAYANDVYSADSKGRASGAGSVVVLVACRNAEARAITKAMKKCFKKHDNCSLTKSFPVDGVDSFWDQSTFICKFRAIVKGT